MSVPALAYNPPKAVHDGVLQYCKNITEFAIVGNSLRQRLEYIDKEFYRENTMVDEDQKAAVANRMGDKRVIRDVVQPILEPQVETNVAFLTSVFLTGFPVFGVTAPPALAAQAKTMEAIIAENSIRGGWRAQLIHFFRSGAKYNLMGVELDWCRKTIYTPVTEAAPGQPTGTQDKNKEMLWEGNKLRSMDMYNTFWDLRVDPSKNHEIGEFVGFTELMSRVALKQFIQDLPSKNNVSQAFETGINGSETGYQSLYYVPQVNPLSNYSMNKLLGAMNWMQWAQLDGKAPLIDYKNIYQVTTRYCRIIPSDFKMGVPKPNQPQIWKIITVNDQVVIYMERLTNAHNFLPIVLCQPYFDGLGLQTKGLGEKLIPLQDLASASWNARLCYQRRKVSDRALYDPSRISPADVNSDIPNAKIPVKSSVYGKPVQDAYHAIPFEDNQTGSFVTDAKEFSSFANTVSGQNQAQQGQFVKGNKTQHEYEDVQGHSSGRQQTLAIAIEDTVFVPVKEMIKLNILQYQPDGPITNPVDGKKYQVQKSQLRDLSFAMKLSDGLTPKEKLISTETLQVALQVIGSSPALQQRFDLGGLFSYLMGQEGADLSPFQLTQQQQVENQETQQDQETAADAKKEMVKQAAGAVGSGQLSLAPPQQK